MALFTDTQIKVTSSDMPSEVKRMKRKGSKTLFKKALSRKTATEVLSKLDIAKNETACIVTNGTSNVGDFYQYYRDKYEVIDELCISTWIISRDYIEILLADIKEGRLKKINFILSNRMAQLKGGSSGHFNFLKMEFDKNPNISLCVINSHAKTFSLKGAGNYITVSGSANWSKNPRIENFVIMNNKEVYDFHQNWMTEIIKNKDAKSK